MQKKTKSRLVDVLVILVCLAGSALSVWQFWKELNKTLVKMNEEPIATISFKYNTAQRKFSDNLVWDRLRQNSPVYNGDTIRTADFSEATIYFNDGNIMDLSENTMARVSLNSVGGAAVDFSGGQISVQTSDSGLTITSGSSVVDVVKGASVTASSVMSSAGDSSGGSSSQAKDEGLRVQVQSGSAALTTGDQAVDLEVGEIAEMKGDGKVVRKMLSVLSPDPESKYLNFEGELISIPFHWNSEGLDVKLELSDTKAFTTVRESYDFVDIDEATLSLSSGTHYWRMICGNESLNGKITIYNTKSPDAVAPVQNYTAHYRSVKPSIRFIWSESERSSTYAFEVADNERMENPVISQRVQQNSSIVTTLEEGKWYWRVTPYYTINNIGFSHPSDVYSFSIEKSGALQPPELLVPKSGAVVSTKVPGSAGTEPQNILFSWRDNPEASSYTITITPDSPAYGSSITETVSSNYFSLDTSTVNIGNGSWKWSVEMSDVEGNKVWSEKNPFMAMDSEISQKPLFPSEGYTLSSTRLRDTNFVWKSNLGSEMEVQFATDSSFKNIVHSFVTKNTTTSGIDLDVGNYYWRIVTTTDAGVFTSDPVNFVIEGPLPAAVCNTPEDGSRVVVNENRTIALSWKPVETADYYQLRVYGSEDTSEVIYENTYIEDDGSSDFTEYVSFAGLDERTIYWTVQAFREETDTKSRSVGLLGKYSFFLRILKPITLSAPSDNTTFEGLDIVMYPPDMEWESIDELNESELLIYKDKVSAENVVASVSNPERKTTMPRLYEGSYFWTVRGISYDDLDVSSKQVRNFKVNKIPPMDAPVQSSPLKTDVFSTAYFDRTLNITFTWRPVLYATKYIFTLTNENGDVLASADIPSPNTSYSVNFGDIIKEGKYSWTIEARTVFDDGVVRYGNKNTSTFVVSLPEMDAPVKDPVGSENILDENVYHRDKSIRFSWRSVPFADEYVFTLMNVHDTVITKEFMKSRNAVAASRNTVPETYFVFTDVKSLEPGEYKWSVEARNYINGKMMQSGKTEESSFSIIVNNMPAPTKNSPYAGKVFGNELFEADNGLYFSWQPVEFADDYVFSLYDLDDKLMTEQVITGTEYTYTDLESFGKSKYSWTVEARSYLNGKLLQHGNVKKTQFEIYLPDLNPPEKISPTPEYILDAGFFINDMDLEFEWNKIRYADEYILTVTDPDGEIIRETSINDADGNTPLVYQIPSGQLLKHGEYKWTVEALSHYHGELLQNGKKEESTFSVVIPDLDAPVALLPVPETVLSTPFYNKDEPLGFGWEDVPLADEYVFTLYNPDGNAILEQSVSETSVYVDAENLLNEGEYTWTVEARSHYRGEVFQYGKKEDHNFAVSLPNLNPTKDVTPVSGSVLGMPFFRKNEPLEFSWAAVQYADDYLFTLYNPDGVVVLKQTVEETSISVDANSFVSVGEYSWTIEARSHFRDRILQHGIISKIRFSTDIPRLNTPALSSPSENTEYGASYFKKEESQKFKWKSVEYADEYVFRLVGSDGRLVAESVLPADTFDVTLDTELFSYEGDYTWSVEAKSYFRNKVLQTSEVAERKFAVVMPPLDIPADRLPADENKYGIELFKRDGAINFSWKTVDSADRYVFCVRKSDGTVVVETIIPSDAADRKGVVRYNADSSLFTSEDVYTWSVDAQVIYKERIIQASGEALNSFIVSLPAPPAPEIVSADPFLIDAGFIDANDTVSLEWGPVEYADEYIIRIYNTDGSEKNTITVPSTQQLCSVLPISDFFTDGSYSWNVEACIRFEGEPFLFSNKAESSVNVVLPDMYKPVVLSPEQNDVLDTSYFRQSREIQFSWEPVPYATSYHLDFFGTDGEILMSRNLSSDETEVSFDDLTRLEPGTFRWTVKAVYSKNDVVLVDGEVMESEFKIKLPTLKAPTVDNTGRLYGN